MECGLFISIEFFKNNNNSLILTHGRRYTILDKTDGQNNLKGAT